MAKQLAAKMVVALTLAAGGGKNTAEGVKLVKKPISTDQIKGGLLAKGHDGTNFCDVFDDKKCDEGAKAAGLSSGWTKRAGAKISPKTAANKQVHSLKEALDQCCTNGSSC